MTWLSAAEALQRLGVRPQTLYANVSRNRIRAKPDPKDTRRSLYNEADVKRLAGRRSGRRKDTAVAAGAIEWGDPILSSALSTVAQGRLFYRGKDAVELAEVSTLEKIACLLWGAGEVEWGTSGRGRDESRDASPLLAGPARAGRSARTAGPAGAAKSAGTAGRQSTSVDCGLALERAFVALGRRAALDAPSLGRALPALQAEAASVLHTLTRAMLNSRSPGDGPIHDQFAAVWRRREAGDLMRRALVLLADHELNASTFATRVSISTGAPLAAGVLSGLATLSGPLHGRAALGVQELLNAARRVGPANAVREWLGQGRSVAGFGHPLYPAEDPRATALLSHMTPPREYLELTEVVEEVIGEKPNVDFAMAVLTEVCGLPREAPLMLFAVARCVGWLAHAIEQATTGHPIRPRARYVGPSVP